MNEALESILCAEEKWSFDPEGRYIKLNTDGTGELWCRCNFNYWIAAEIEWERVDGTDDANIPNNILNNNNNNNNSNTTTTTPTQVSTTKSLKPQELGTISLHLTLRKRIPSWARTSVLSKSSSMLNELDAFDTPRTYVVRMEKGNFVKPCAVGYGSDEEEERFALRIVFDRSPYPPRAQWRNPDGGPDSGRFWDHVEFVARPDPDLSRRVRPMNDPASGQQGWGCVVM
ncbi:hypothetical protein F5Y17DRAFT_460111 [Xylariaceae sp. FL0594]|nr:hypothetical protein F5Y17DRAFT_460111 [Xylariaceae sp. FL0594]